MSKTSINNFLLQNQLPSNLAIITPHKSFTYKQLAIHSNFCQKYFSQRKIAENDLVGIFSEHTIEFIISVLALWKLRAVPVLLNPKITQNEINGIMQSANCKTVVGSGDQLKKYNFTNKVISSLSKEFQENLIDEKTLKINSEKTAAIIFTSGTSEKPKGVQLSFNSFYQSGIIGNNILNHSSEDRWLASLPFYHVGGFSILTRALLFGVPVIVPESIQTEKLIKFINEYKPTLISLVSTQLKRLVDNKIKPNPELKNVLLGGGFISGDLIEQALELGWKITNVYGSTETTSFVTSLSSSEFIIKPGSVGKPVAPNKIKIVDENNNELDKNITGEILISSPALMLGYLNEDDTEKEYFHTNDIGFIDDDGYIFLECRKSDMIISGGENINSLEVEIEIYTHSAIKEVSVFPLISNEWGETVAAEIILNEGIDNFKIDELISFLKDKLAGYKIPKNFFFVNEIPKTDLGKVDKKKLTEKYSKTNL